MSGVQPVNLPPVANDLRTIFDTLSYGPAPEADNVAQVIVYFKWHALFGRHSLKCYEVASSAVLTVRVRYVDNPYSFFSLAAVRAFSFTHLCISDVEFLWKFADMKFLQSAKS